MPRHTDTIAALATPSGESGIAVVRVSGEGALAALSRVLRTPAGRPFPDAWEHRRLYHGRFVAPDETPLDDVMAAVMRAPESYTGEDVVEVSCHGGGAVVARVLETLYAHDVRPAEPGEFTRWAFLNGKMDLIQAEAVADLIHARTEVQRSVAERQLRGALSERMGALATRMTEILAEIEANIDFIEEGIDAFDAPRALATIGHQLGEIDDLLGSAAFARPLRDGFRVVIAGPVNAGKSSLFNRLLGDGRAIVTDIPGTTRDVLRESISIDGIPFVIHDTAGLREAGSDRVEAIGIERARGAVLDADVIVFVVDGSEAPAPDVRRALGHLDAARALVVVNKSDLPPHADVTAMIDRPVIAVSAETGAGVDELKRALLATVRSETLARMARERVILNARLVSLLESVRGPLAELGRAVRDREALEILAARAREVLAYYEEATGRRYSDDLLDVIFSRFCIGK